MELANFWHAEPVEALADASTGSACQVIFHSRVYFQHASNMLGYIY